MTQHNEINTNENKRIIDELNIARRSQPSPVAQQQYYAAYEHIEKRDTSLAGIVQRIVAMVADLSMDSRQRLPEGVRNAASVSRYRLLYSTERADVELMVEPTAQDCRIEGAVMELDNDDMISPVLVQLQNQSTDEIMYETESDEHGRFRLSQVTSGTYQMFVMPVDGEYIQINDLEIS